MSCGKTHSSGKSHTNVGTLDSSLRCPEAQTDILVPSLAALSCARRLASLCLGVEEDVWLFLFPLLDCVARGVQLHPYIDEPGKRAHSGR
jgi:hypothetical protein